MRKHEILYLAICLMVFGFTVSLSETINPAQLCADHWALYSIMTIGFLFVALWKKK